MTRDRLKTAAKGVSTILALAAGIGFWTCLPDSLFTDPMSPVLLARDGNLLGARIATDGQWRFSAGASAVPEKFRSALIAFEDRRFLYHPGVDPLALARAAYRNATAGEVVSGGSTITMQVTRLARGNRERTYRQKFIEMLWSLRLELASTKDEIIGLYAAHAPFGGNVVGLEAAAWRYFGRGPDALSWAETATLAVLPNSPALIHPGRNRARLEEKRNALLTRLHEAGHLDELALRLALLEPLPGVPQPLPRLAPHLLETLVARDVDTLHRYESTVSATLQSAVQSIVTRHTEALGSIGIRNAAVLVLDNQNFETLAYVGNSQWSVTSGSGYAIDLIHRPRSTGSVLKPLLFARMLDAGEILPPTLIPDVPAQYAGYMPENYDRRFRGAVPAKLALARSLNVPAVWMLQEHGIDRFYDFLERMGMSTLHRQPQEYGLTLILGGAEGTLWDLTSMYANVVHIAGQSARAPAEAYRRPRLVRGEVAAAQSTAQLSVGAAWLTLEALLEVVRPGAEAHWRRFASSQEIAWKTGTSFGHRDGWAIGSTAKYTVGVWVGNATGEGRPELTGLGTAAPILFDVFNRLERAEWFPRPELALKQVDVCKNDGHLAREGCETETAWAPFGSHFERATPNQRLVHLDPSGTWRVHDRCEAVHQMRHETWFVLPPTQEYYYRRQHSEYRRLPPYRADCTGYAVEEGRGPIDFLYPSAGARIYIPVDLSARKGRVVFAVAHRDPDAALFWHLDDRFIGTTQAFHEQALDIAAGIHLITVVDQNGNRAIREFEILAKDDPSGTI